MENAIQLLKCDSCGKEFEKPKAFKMHLLYEREKLEKAKAEQQPVTKPVEKPDFTLYKRLPPPIIQHLERSWGNWLNHFEVKLTDWKSDFGGPAIEIKIPQAFSTEWEEVIVTTYDNKTRTKIGEKKEWKPDIRICSLKDIAETIKWLDKVREHVVTNAFRKGLLLPTTGIKYDIPNKTLEDYKRELAGV